MKHFLRRHGLSSATVTLIVLLASASSLAQGTPPLTLGPLFQDHAVVQRDRPLAIWGTAPAGVEIAVSLAGRQASARADSSGNWTVTLPAAPAGGPYVLEARSSAGATKTVADVMVGDVFLCSGQSNMAFGVGQSRGADMIVARSANERVRLITVAQVGAPQPASRFGEGSTWQVAAPDSVRRFSAACYFFGREVLESQKVPVGLVNASWGGTAIEPWIAGSGLSALGGFAPRLDILKTFARDEEAANQEFGRLWQDWWRGHGAAAGEPWKPGDNGPWSPIPGLRNWKTWGVPILANHDGMVWYRRAFTLTAAQAARAATLALGGIDEVDQTWVNGRIVRNTFGWGNRRTYRLAAGTLHEGENVLVVNVLSTYDAGGLLGPADAMSLSFDDGSAVALGEGWQYRAVPLSMGRPPRAPWETIAGLTMLYNGMIAPMGSWGFRAVAWYQGESNTDDAANYGKLLGGLMAGWRSQFGAELPFLIVQLPNFGALTTKPTEDDWAGLREAQRRAVAADAHAGLVVTIDIGEPDNLHPTNKREVGRRLARAARKVVYGEPIVPSGPTPVSATRGPMGVVVSFDGVEDGFVTYSSDKAIGFELCGPTAGSCRFVTGQVKDKTVVLPVAGAPAAAPTRVRFCWGASPITNLADKSGLPVVPFELPIK